MNPSVFAGGFFISGVFSSSN